MTPAIVAVARSTNNATVAEAHALDGTTTPHDDDCGRHSESLGESPFQFAVDTGLGQQGKLKAEGFNYDEIAATLGLARGAIGTTLARARRRLVDAYRAQGRSADAAS